MSSPWPKDIILNKEKSELCVSYDNGATFNLSAEYLRVHSQSAEVKGHGQNQETLVFGKKNIAITELEAVGNYALKITFSDGHDTGLYTWQYLYDLGDRSNILWQKYLSRLEKAGKKR